MNRQLTPSERLWAKFERERREAYRTMDLVWARKQCPPGENPPDEILLIAMHKARYECTTIPDAWRHESRAWLEARGYGRRGNAPFPAPGVLEK